jgi:hypothetical protein
MMGFCAPGLATRDLARPGKGAPGWWIGVFNAVRQRVPDIAMHESAVGLSWGSPGWMFRLRRLKTLRWNQRSQPLAFVGRWRSLAANAGALIRTGIFEPRSHEDTKSRLDARTVLQSIAPSAIFSSSVVLRGSPPASVLNSFFSEIGSEPRIHGISSRITR